VAFYDRVTAFVDKGRATDVTYLDLSKAFDTELSSLGLSTSEKRRLRRQCCCSLQLPEKRQ